MNTAIHVQEVRAISNDLNAKTERLKRIFQRYEQAPDPLIALIEVFYNQRRMKDNDDSADFGASK